MSYGAKGKTVVKRGKRSIYLLADKSKHFCMQMVSTNRGSWTVQEMIRHIHSTYYICLSNDPLEVALLNYGSYSNGTVTVTGVEGIIPCASIGCYSCQKLSN